MAKKRKNRSYTYVKGATKPVIRFRFKVVVIIFIVITAICFAIYMTGVNFGGDEEGSFTVTWEETTEETTVETEQNQDDDKNNDSNSDESSDLDDDTNNTSNSIENPVPESSAMSQTYFEKCVFVGDSITVGLADYQLVPMKNVIAEIGMNIEKINTETMQTEFGDTTVLDALIQSNPENLYIMLGSNGIAWLSIDSMIEEYKEFTENIKKSLPETKIYILSIPPVTTGRENSDQPISNETIVEYNLKLLNLANEKGYYYVDTHSALKDDFGVLPTEDATEDGMHFNKATYDKMLDYILSHVAK